MFHEKEVVSISVHISQSLHGECRSMVWLVDKAQLPAVRQICWDLDEISNIDFLNQTMTVFHPPSASS